MGRVIGLVAYHVFKESVRDKVLYNLVFFAVLMIGASYLIGQLTAGQDVKIIKDLGLAASSVFGLFIAVFIGVGLVWKEVDRRSVYNLLVKPLRRHEFIVGKFCRPCPHALREHCRDDGGALRGARASCSGCSLDSPRPLSKRRSSTHSS